MTNSLCSFILINAFSLRVVQPKKRAQTRAWMVKSNFALILALLLISNHIIPLAVHAQTLPLSTEYLGFIENKINDSFKYPQEARLKGWEGIVKVRFTISTDGRIKDIDVAESSGYPLLDAAAILAIKDASPYPFPADFSGEELQITVPVDYRQIEPYQKKVNAYSYTPIRELAEKLDKAAAAQQSLPALEKIRPKQPAPLELPQESAPEEPYIDIKNDAAEMMAREFVNETQKSGQTPLPAVKPESLDHLLNIAVKNNQPTKVAGEEIALAELKVAEAQRELYPSLKLSNYYTYGDVYSVDYEETETKVQVEQPIDYNRQLRDTVTQAISNLQITKKNYDRLKLDVINKTEVAYYNFVSAKMHLAQKRLLEQEAKDLLVKIEKLSQAGMIIPLEANSARSWFNQLKLQTQSIDQEVLMAELTLKQVLNVKELPAIESGALQAQKLSLDLDTCLNTALSYRPEIYLSQLLVKFNQYGKKIEKDKDGFNMNLIGSYGFYSGHYLTEPWKNASNWYAGFKVTKPFGPSTLNASYTSERTEPRFGQTSPTGSSTASGEFAFFDDIKRLSDQKKSDIDLRRSLSDFDETFKTINFEVQDAFLKYEKAFMQLNTAEEEMRFRRNEVDLIKTRALVGEGNLSGTMESIYHLSEAHTRYIQSLANYYLSLATLKKACGYGLNV